MTEVRGQKRVLPASVCRLIEQSCRGPSNSEQSCFLHHSRESVSGYRGTEIEDLSPAIGGELGCGLPGG